MEQKLHEWRLHDFSPFNKYNSSYHIHLGGMGKACVAYGGQKNAYKVSMVNAEEETPLRRFKRWLEVYIT